MKTIPQILVEMAAHRPDFPAICDQTWQLSYVELLQEVQKTARKLRDIGLKSGERFGIWAPNCAEWIVVALAGQTLGAVLVTLNTRYKGVEAADILRRADCKYLFTVEGFLESDFVTMLKNEHVPNLRETIVIRGAEETRSVFDRFTKSTEPLPVGDIQLRDPQALSDIIFTSGTTGAPKGVMTTHAQNVDVFKAFTDAIGMTGDDRYLIVNPFFHSFGYKAGWLSCLIKGAVIYPLAVFDPVDVFRRIERDRITVMPGAPTIFQMLLTHRDRENYDLSSLRVATIGAATIPVDLIRQMHDVLGIDNVYSAYGQTESTGVISLCRKGDDFETIATTCGRALPGTELRIVGDDGRDMATGEQGEIRVRGFHVMQGYLDNEQATRETITDDGWLKTGDIGIMDADGYIRITDRKKDMVIVGGFNCSPAEVEKILLQHEAIADVAVTGMPDARLGEVTHAHIVKAERAELDEQAVIDWARENMANYKVPRRVTFHRQLPRNASGKVMKFRL